MIDIKRIRESPDIIVKGMKSRGVDFKIDEIIVLDEKRRVLIKEVDTLKNERNIESDKIWVLKRSGKSAEQETLNMKKVSRSIKELDIHIKGLEAELYSKQLIIPNIPDSSVPEGRSENDNIEIRRSGKKREFEFEPLSHQEIGERLGIIDFIKGSKITGSGFVVFKGEGAQIERSLINFMLDIHTKEHQYCEISPPFLVNEDSLITTGNLPKFEDDLYKIESDKLYMIPTAEVPVTNIHRKEILEEKSLPLKYVSYTPCFRREAGSWGKETKGLIRQHQFDKVELVKFTKPEESIKELELLISDAEEILKRLKLPYRVVQLCTGDIGFSSAITYDLEVWLPSQNRYIEISSCSCFTDFQARRGEIRYRPKLGGKPRYVHTLNGSALAVGRTLVAILENYQEPDGSVVLPESLRAYCAVEIK